jgi:hypothetical protein
MVFRTKLRISNAKLIRTADFVHLYLHLSMISMRSCFCGIIWIVGVVHCELDPITLRSPSCLEHKTLISEGPTSYHSRKFRAGETGESHAKNVGQFTTLKRGDVLSLRGGGGCLSFPRKAAKQKQNLSISFDFVVHFNTSAMNNFTKFSPGVLGSCEILGKWDPNQVRMLEHPSCAINLSV